jgi:hypothetical protein
MLDSNGPVITSWTESSKEDFLSETSAIISTHVASASELQPLADRVWSATLIGPAIVDPVILAREANGKGG